MRGTSTFGKKGNRRRGLRIVLWLLGFSFLAQVLGGLVLDYFWVRARFPWQADVYANLLARAHPPEILFLGSSRFCSDWDCGILDAGLRHDLGEHAPRTFNAAVPVGDPTAGERIFDELVDMGYHPKLVVIEVNPVMVARGDYWLPDQALRLLDWRDTPEVFLPLCKNGRILHLLRGRLLPLYTHRYEICKDGIAILTGLCHPQPNSTAIDPPIPALPQEDPPPPPPCSADQAAMTKVVCNVVARQLVGFQPGGVAVRRLERLLHRCRSMGTAVLLVQPPVSSEYRRAINARADTVFLGYMQHLCRTYGCRYCNWIDRLPDSYFRDEHHAHAEGGVYLSRRFVPLVLTPLWRDLENTSKGSEDRKSKSVSNSL